MNSSTEGPNPLRPYYVPPPIGLPDSQATSKVVSSAAAENISSFGTSARDILSDFDYADYLGESSPSIADSIKQLLENAAWRYSRVLISQPFEVAKTILQVYVAEDAAAEAEEERRRLERHRMEHYEEEVSYGSDDENNYFTSSATAPPPSSRNYERSSQRITERGGYIPQGVQPKYMLKIKDSSSMLDVLSQLWATSGPTSIWKASNTTFIYSILLPTLNTFVRSLLSAILGYPEDSFSSFPAGDIITSSAPGTALVLSCLSSALSAIILSPIDTARTYLILTPHGHGPRSLLHSTRLLPSPSYMISPHLLPITILTSTLPNLIATSTPLFLKSYLSLDPVLNPSTWSLFSLMAQGLELTVRVPLETVLRRAQIATFTSPALRQLSSTHTPPAIQSPTSERSSSVSAGPNSNTPLPTIVPAPQIYRGIVGTMWSIIYEEGTNPNPTELDHAEEAIGHTLQVNRNARRQMQKRRKGQGLQGLYRSWRLEMWGIVGIWGSGFLGALMSGGDDEIVSDSMGRMALGSTGSHVGTGKGAF
ncbi:mitochondrial fusion and transport protein Ugo1 [Arthroderma uncinatum]|uniref:mitochondrial fusion and transport protein Ugo1 n=1 Tax=Arthroderma uncinatum TaxID=74035 RepID=UPI00144AEA5F|nr:mitochondrial fusion and transport protein Ugo1 [Arthroderma uncinatum]KAF3479475.1 mitochondrial fusion and transport protein Ugo1 [Arthroderma uncinatum]